MSTDLPASTHIASGHLQIRDLQQSLAFYSDLLGFRIVRHEKQDVWLSATGEAPHLIHLTERQDALPRPPHATGLFHVAYRAPDRAGLGRWLHHAEQKLRGCLGAPSETFHLQDHRHL